MNPFKSVIKRLHAAERRRFQRIELPRIRLRIDGKRYDAIDWSLGGFKVGRCHLSLASGENVAGRIQLEHGPSGEFVAEVVGVREDGEVAFRLLEITPSVFLAMGGIKEA